MIVDKLIEQKPMGIPYGKAIWLILALALGKFTVRGANRIIRNVLKPTDPNYIKNTDLYTKIFGFVAGSGAAYGLGHWGWLERKLGTLGTEGLVLGTTTGMLDAMFQRSGLGYQNRDVSNWISEGITDELAKIVEKVKGVALIGPKGNLGALASPKRNLGALPEHQSSAWENPREEEYIQSPEESPRQAATTPLSPVDPAQFAEEVLAEKSKI